MAYHSSNSITCLLGVVGFQSNRKSQRDILLTLLQPNTEKDIIYLLHTTALQVEMYLLRENFAAFLQSKEHCPTLRQ